MGQRGRDLHRHRRAYSLTPGYYCNGLSIAQTSDDQIDLREELGYACGNFMYSGNTELLTSNFSEDLRDFYDRQGSTASCARWIPPLPSTRIRWRC